MTVSEHLERSSFAYDPQFPPDCEAGQPLTTVLKDRPSHEHGMKRVLKSAARVIARRR